ncbi:YlbE family protein [Enterococcus sp. LJL99]
MSYQTIDDANRAVIDKVIASAPFLLDVVPAKTVIPELEGHVLLHAGPPIKWEEMTNPMQGSCIGAVLFEEWAADEEGAVELLANGKVKFIPCHEVQAVGPMGGITSANMPVFVVENKTDNNRAYCTMNEGIGAVLRFGAYSQEVIDRLRWMRDTLGPVLGKAVRTLENGLNLNVLVAKAVAMGDEFHQRNIAASLAFLKEMAPIITVLPISEEEKKQTIKFLADTDQFFLNIMMAATKAVMDGARQIESGTVVTAMCRNGKDFGIRISGMGDEWFTAPVNTPQGLYFSGYSSEDANTDIGDSAITETFGVGGMAMIAAPAVTRFVGTGGFYEALAISNEMTEICIDHNPNFPVPTWDFKGICLGIDARKVVETGITPVINTGIAHKKAGIGQIGAGTVNPPVECFEKAIAAYAKKLGMK